MVVENWEQIKEQLRVLINKDAKPKYRIEHIDRVWRLCQHIKSEYSHIDVDVLYIAVMLHDIGTFLGHRPRSPQKLIQWNHIDYAISFAEKFLDRYHVSNKCKTAVVAAIENHLLDTIPTTDEGATLRDADLLDSVGIMGVCRVFYKIGDLIDSRFTSINDSLDWLETRHKRVRKALLTEQGKKIFRLKEVNYRQFVKTLRGEMSL